MSLVSAKDFLEQKNNSPSTPSGSSGGGLVSAKDFLGKKQGFDERAKAEMNEYREYNSQFTPDVSQQPAPPKIEPPKKPFLAQIQSDIYDNTIGPVADKFMRAAVSAVDAIAPGDDRARMEQAPDYQRQIFGKSLDAPETFGDHAADIIGNLYGSTPAVLGAYGTGGKLAVQGLSKIAPNAGNLLKNTVRGIGAGAVYAPIQEGIEAAQGKNESLFGIENRALDTAANVALFGAGDAAFGLAGKGLQALGKKYSGTKIGDYINRFSQESPTQPDSSHEQLALPLGRGDARIRAANERSNLPYNNDPVAPYGESPTYSLPEGNYVAPQRLRVETDPLPYINKAMERSRPIVAENMTPPLENPNELAKWVHEKMDVPDLSLNEVRRLPYEDLRQLAEEMRSRMSVQDEAYKAASQQGFNLPNLFEGRTPSIAERMAADAQKRAYGVYPDTLPNIKQPEGFNTSKTSPAAAPESVIKFNQPDLIAPRQSKYRPLKETDFPFESPVKEGEVLPASSEWKPDTKSFMKDEDYPFTTPPEHINGLGLEAKNAAKTVKESPTNGVSEQKLNTPGKSPEIDDIVVDPEDVVVPRVRDRLTSTADKWIEEANRELAAQRNTLNSNPIAPYATLSKLMAGHILKGTVKLADATEILVKQFGEEIRPHVKNIWSMAKEEAAAIKKKSTHEDLGINEIPLPMMKDISGYQTYMNDVYRNFEHAFGDQFPKIKKSILDPFDKSKAENINMQESWLEKLKTEVVDKLGIKKGSNLSALVQKYGEKQIDIVDLKSQAPNDWEKVIEADNWFKKAYDQLLDEVNGTRAQIYPNNPDKIIPKRADYYRHFQDYDSLSGLRNLFDSPSQIDPGLVGISEFLTPKSKWAGFMQKRGLGPFKNDAVGGFLNYLPSATYATHIDPQIEVFKSLAKNIAEETTDSKNMNNFINFLQRFSQDLGGKTNPADRFIQEVIPGGRKTMAAVQWLNNRVKANTILGNVGSSLAQVANIPNGMAFAKQHSIKGAGEYLKSLFKPSEVMKQSDFLKERFIGKATRQFDTRWFEQPKNFAAWMLETSDRIGTEFVWNSAYAKGVAENASNPIKFADDATRKLVAGRGIGEVPLLQKSKLFQLVAPFQLEVANLWKVQKEFIDKKDFGALATLYLSAYLLNQGMERVRGSRVMFDPIQAFVDAAGEDLSPMERVGRVAGEALSNVPLGQTLASVYPEKEFSALGVDFPSRKKLFGQNDPTRFGGGVLAVSGAQDPVYKVLPSFGGNQIKKSIQGFQALAEGGHSNNGKLSYEVDSDPLTAAQSILLGPNSTSGAREYYDKERRPLSEEQTKQVKRSPDSSRAYNNIMHEREMEKIERQIDEVFKNTKLSKEERLAKTRLLQEKLKGLKQKQQSTPR